MLDKIKINVDNFSFIKNAEFVVDGITVVKGIGGKNKSDLNRLIYSLLLSVSNEGLNIANTRFKETLFDSISTNSSFIFQMEYNKFINNWEEYNVSKEYLNKKVIEFKKLLKKHNVTADFTKINQALKFNDEYNSYRVPVFDYLLDVEFKDMRYLKFDDYGVDVEIDDQYHLIVNKKVNGIESKFSYELDCLPGNVIYLSPKPIMDFEFKSNIPYHYEELYYLLTENQIMCKTDTDDIDDLIADTIGGEFALFGFFDFFTKDFQKILVEDLPRGYKQLGVLQLLLENYALPEKSILIIDNIDSRMDDQLQIKTAEILAKLTERLNLLLFINTKSDIFIKAINKYDEVISIRNYEANENNGEYTFELL